jgi:hypothetical protein
MRWPSRKPLRTAPLGRRDQRSFVTPSPVSRTRYGWEDGTPQEALSSVCRSRRLSDTR